MTRRFWLWVLHCMLRMSSRLAEHLAKNDPRLMPISNDMRDNQIMRAVRGRPEAKP
jgi:hypothetical protein